MLCAAPDTFLGAGIQTARAIVDSGIVGDITSCVAVLQRDAGLLAEKFPYTIAQGGGIGIDVGIYYATALLSILGPAKKVCGMSQTYQPERTHFFTSRGHFGESYTITAETLLAATVQFASGAVGSFHFNSASIRCEKPQLILYGTQGIVYLPDPNFFGGEVRVLAKGQTTATTAASAWQRWPGPCARGASRAPIRIWPAMRWKCSAARWKAAKRARFTPCRRRSNARQRSQEVTWAWNTGSPSRRPNWRFDAKGRDCP